MRQHLQHFIHLRPSIRRALYSSLGGSAGILGILLAVGLYIVETLLRPNKKGNFFSEYAFSPYEFALPAEAVTFSPAKGDYTLNGWFVPCEGATTTILVCPGYRTRKSDMLGISAHLWRAGHNVLIFDFYGHGTASGTRVTLGYRETRDFLGAVAYAKERTPSARLGVIAYSMGASVALMCGARCPDIEAIISDSAFASHWSAIEYNVRRANIWPPAPFVWIADLLMGWRGGYRFHEVEPLREIANISPRPLLLIQGEKDSIVDPRDAVRLNEKAREPKALWLLPDADHCGAYFVDREDYTARVLNFFDSALRQPRLHLVSTDQASGGNPDEDNPSLLRAS